MRSICIIWYVADRRASPSRQATIRACSDRDTETIRKMEGHRAPLRAARTSCDQGLQRRGPLGRVEGASIIEAWTAVARDLPRGDGSAADPGRASNTT